MLAIGKVVACCAADDACIQIRWQQGGKDPVAHPWRAHDQMLLQVVFFSCRLFYKSTNFFYK
jgi:hypothetical protein